MRQDAWGAFPRNGDAKKRDPGAKRLETEAPGGGPGEREVSDGAQGVHGITLERGSTEQIPPPVLSAGRRGVDS